MRTVEFSLEELYDIGFPRRPCHVLLDGILEFYSLDESVVLLVNYSPDVGVEIPVNNTSIDVNAIRSMAEEELDKALSDVANVKVKLNDGYEIAIAYLKTVEGE